jgi:hypothetical protein
LLQATFLLILPEVHKPILTMCFFLGSIPNTACAPKKTQWDLWEIHY